MAMTQPDAPWLGTSHVVVNPRFARLLAFHLVKARCANDETRPDTRYLPPHG